jgi:transposase
VGFCCAGSAGGATGRTTANHQPSCRPQRHLLPFADRLPVATVATRISSVWHGLPLLSSLAKLRCVGPSTSSALRAGPSSCRTGSLSIGGDHGWPIGQDDRAWRRAWFRRAQARKGTQTPHLGRHTLGLPVANRVEPANTSDRRSGALLLGGLSALFPRIRTIIADAGHESRKLAQSLKQHQGWQLRIVRRRQRAFKITGLNWIVERSFAWLGRNRRLSKDYEYRLQTSETMIDLASIRLMLNRIAPV